MDSERKRQRKRKIWFGISVALLTILTLLFFWEFDVTMRSMEKERNHKLLENYAKQTALSAEVRLSSTQFVLSALGKGMTPDAIEEPKMKEYLTKIAKENGMDRIGVADIHGNVKTTNDLKMRNVYDLEFFQEAMRGKKYISTVFFSKDNQEESIVLSVPIIEENQEIIGVLCGVILVDQFDEYVYQGLQKNIDYSMYIIDNQGNYLVKEATSDELGEAGDNFFENLKRYNVDVYDMKQSILERKDLFLEIDNEKTNCLMLLSPMRINRWYSVMVIPEKEAVQGLVYSKKMVLRLIIKLMITIALILTVTYRLLAKEKKEIKVLNQELLLKDQIFQMAISDTGSYVFTYHADDNSVEFLNYSNQLKTILPKRLHDFPECLEGFIAKNSVAYQEILRMYKEMKQGQDIVEGNISLDLYGKVAHYKARIMRVEEGKQSGDIVAIGTMVDMTTEKLNEIVLKSQIGRDPLTNAYNRGAAMEKINALLQSPETESGAFLIMDVDNFKAVNDSLGHLIGDQALIEVTNIIRHHVHDEDIVCRLGGDEFVVFMVNIPECVITRNVRVLLKKLERTYEVGGKQERISASIGIAVAPKDGQDFQELYEKADKALYRIKKNGKNGCGFYDEEQDA